MKSLRVLFLMAVLFVGATSRPAPVTNQTDASASETAEPECYLINGVWFCP
jgi:hypothetical protein